VHIRKFNLIYDFVFFDEIRFGVRLLKVPVALIHSILEFEDIIFHTLLTLPC